MVSLVSTLLLLAPLVVRVVCYKVVRDYSGDNFFSGWDFYGNFDDQTFGTFVGEIGTPFDSHSGL
jgi:hypothetical protein